MSKIETITANEARFPLASLTLSPLNPRQDVPEAEIAELAESIWTAGLIQSIAGLADGKGGAEIVAGGRRLRALQFLAAKHEDLATSRPELANPLVMLAADEATARIWANLENVARRDLNPAEEIRAYGKMEAAGSSAAMIARAFAVTEKHVYRRLALANLPAPVVDALAAGEINLSMAKCFTIATDETTALEVLERVKGRDMSDYHLKQLLQPQSIRSTDHRAQYLGLEAYQAAGGTISSDLFAEETLLTDVQLLSELCFAKLDAEAKDYAAANGFAWAEASTETGVYLYQLEQQGFIKLDRIEGVLTEEQAARYDELAAAFEAEALSEAESEEFAALDAITEGSYSDEQKAHSGVIFHLNHRGEVAKFEALVRKEDRAAAAAAGIIEDAKANADAPEKSPISQTLKDDLGRIVTGARQHALLRDPETLLALLAYQLSGRMGYRTALAIREDQVSNEPTQTQGYEVDPRVTAKKVDALNHFDADLVKDFKAFRKQGPEAIQAEIVNRIGALLTVSDKGLAAMLDKEAKTNVREVWTPTAANFFSRVGAPYMLALWQDLLGLKADHPTVTTFDKLKKGEKAEKLEKLFGDEATRAALGLTEKQIARIANWTPEGMI